MYRFHRCQSHPDFPNLIGWYLELRPDDLATFMVLHEHVTRALYVRYGMDPHLKDNPHYNPLILASGWVESVEKFREEGVTLEINCHGGMWTLDGLIILATVEQEELQWPDHFDDEVITISKWPDAKHYYLCSNKNRIFVPDKFNQYEDAEQAALLYTNNVVSR